MGKIMSRFTKQYYRFNAENRAHREISKEKPSPAPKHPSSEKVLQKILEDTQHIKDESLRKDPQLDEYLKKVYVKSYDPVLEKRQKLGESGKLPLRRKAPEETPLGYFEPEVVPKGKATLMLIMKFLADHQGDPKLFNVSKISKDYSLSEQDVENVLNYFSSFKLYVKEDLPPELGSEHEKILKYFGRSNEAVLESEMSKLQEFCKTLSCFFFETIS